MSSKPIVRLLLSSALMSGTAVWIPAGSPAMAYTELSGPSPFAGCNVSSEPGTLFTNAEVEPWVDANPSNPNNLIAG